MTNEQYIIQELLSDDGWEPEYSDWQTKKILYMTFGRHVVGGLLTKNFDKLCYVIEYEHGMQPFVIKDNKHYVYFG